MSSVGGSHLVVISGCGVVVMGAGSLLVAWGCRLEAVGLLHVFVVHGRSGDVSSAVWSALARLEGMRVGVLTIDNSITNDEQQHRRRSSFAMSLSATWHLHIILVMNCVDTG